MSGLSPNVIKLLNQIGYFSNDEIIQKNTKETEEVPTFVLYKIESNDINKVELNDDFPVSYKSHVNTVIDYLVRKNEILENVNSVCLHRNNFNLLNIVLNKKMIKYIYIDIEPLMKQSKDI